MKKKWWLIPVAVVGLVLVVFVGFVGVVTFNGWSLSQGRYLESKDGQPMIVLNNSPISLIADNDLFKGLTTGDEVLILHGGVAESYPGQTVAHALLKLREGTADDVPQTVVDELVKLGWLEAEPVEIPTDEWETTLLRVHYSADRFYFEEALNSDKLSSGTYSGRIPIFKIDTKQEWEQFQTRYESVFFLPDDPRYVDTINPTLAQYDEAFFAEQSLLIACFYVGSGSYEFDVSSVYCNRVSVCVHVQQTNNPQMVTCDLACWFAMVAVPDSALVYCTEFDADLTRPNN